MNAFSNIWNHPRTSAAGLLISLVTISGVLGQQGITLGKAGTGSVVALLSALGTALLGLLARDPDPQPVPVRNDITSKLGAWALIALLLPFMSGCSGKAVAQDIVNWTPAQQSAVASVDSTVALLAPADAPILLAATAGFDAASNLLVSQANAYLANPSAGTLAQMQAQVVVLQQQINVALLQAARIVNPSSQQHALAAVQAVAAVASAVLALVQSISSKTAIAQMAAHSTIKLAAVRPYLNQSQAAATIANHYGESQASARFQIAQLESMETQAGF